MSEPAPTSPDPRRFSIWLPRPLWIGILGIVALFGAMAIAVGPQVCDCILDNKILMQRLRVDSSMEVEIWQDCEWEASSPISYSLKRKGFPRTRYSSFAFEAPPSLSRIRVELVKFDRCDVSAVVDALSPKSVFVLIDKRTGDAYSCLELSEDRRAFGKEMLAKFNVAAAENDYALAAGFCDKWWKQAERFE